MKLGLALPWNGARVELPVARVQLAERLGFDSVWSAEAYGSDAITPLAYLAALTTRIRLGTDSGYDLASDLAADQPYHTASGDGAWSRHASEGWFKIWDLAKPVIAQVHGYAMAGGSELAAACDLVYVAEDAKIGYPVVRMVSPPDMQFHPWLVGMRRAMELMLTGDAISGSEAAAIGLANRAFPAAELDERVLELAERVAKIPADLQQLNKRSVHRAMDVMGIRAAIRAGSELQALATHQPSVKKLLENLAASMKQAFDKPS